VPRAITDLGLPVHEGFCHLIATRIGHPSVDHRVLDILMADPIPHLLHVETAATPTLSPDGDTGAAPRASGRSAPAGGSVNPTVHGSLCPGLDRLRGGNSVSDRRLLCTGQEAVALCAKSGPRTPRERDFDTTTMFLQFPNMSLLHRSYFLFSGQPAE